MKRKKGRNKEPTVQLEASAPFAATGDIHDAPATTQGWGETWRTWRQNYLRSISGIHTIQPPWIRLVRDGLAVVMGVLTSTALARLIYIVLPHSRSPVQSVVLVLCSLALVPMSCWAVWISADLLRGRWFPEDQHSKDAPRETGGNSEKAVKHPSSPGAAKEEAAPAPKR